MKLTSVDQLTYSEFVFSLENPTCFNLLSAEPLEGQLILDINPSILYPIIDRLLGGSTRARHCRRAGRSPKSSCGWCRGSPHCFSRRCSTPGKTCCKLELAVDRVESNPQLVQIVPPNEVVVLISFELTLGEMRGMMNLCIPFNSIERISNKLTANSWVSYSKQPPSVQSMQRISNQIAEAPVEVVVELATTRITTSDMLGLRVGDIIASEKDIRESLVVYIQGMPKFVASPGKYKGRKAIQIRSGYQPPNLRVSPESIPAAGG